MKLWKGMWLNKIFLLITLNACIILASPNGAPGTEEVCSTMVPNHGHSPQPENAPATVEVVSGINSGQRVSITLRIESGRLFRGFLIQAREPNGNIVSGKFISSSDVNTRNCFGISSSTATHTNSADKTFVVIEWEAPEVTEQLIFNFVFTIVSTFDVYWVRTVSPLNVILPNMSPPTGETSSTTEEITTTTEDPNEYDFIFKTCGQTKTCFGYPNLCFKNGNCDYFGAVTYDRNEFTFELLSMNNAQYIAMGLSFDTRMEDDSVIECIRAVEEPVKAYSSWTVRGPAGSPRTGIDQSIIQYESSMILNGRVYCKVRRNAITTIRGTTFNLLNQNFHLLLASGPNINPDSVGFHGTNRFVSRDSTRLTIPRNLEGGSAASASTLLLIHGSFMIVAWIGCTSIGIVVARYFKSSWPNRKIAGKDVWFIWHVLCMLLTWTLTLAAFIIIFIDVGEWRTSVHSVTGCIAFAIAIAHPIGAIFRPAPNDEARPIFNWMHKAFGNIAHILAVITIFFAVEMPSSRLPQYTLYILAGYAGFYVLLHILFMTVDICANMKTKKRLGVSSSKDVPYRLLQKTLFGFYVIVIVSIVIALILILTIYYDD